MVNEDTLSAVLSEFARTVITDFPIQGILDHLVGRIVEVLPVTAAGVTLISAGAAPRYVAASDEDALRYEQLQTEIGQGPCLSAFETGEAVAVSDLRSDVRYPLFAPPATLAGLAAVFTFPLRHGDDRLGALDLYRDTPGDLDPHDMVAAQTLADVAAAYLLNAEAREHARSKSDGFYYDSLHDALTGLPNRVLLQERLEHAAKRAERSHTSSAIIFADLDHFKEVNDVHGHSAGDDLLVAVAHRLAGLVRSGDTLARFSGDEFVVLCEDLADTGDIDILAARIVEAFVAPFVLGNIELSIAASIGIAYAGPGEQISLQLVADADMAMYEAKRKGGGGNKLIDVRDVIPTDSETMESELRIAFAGHKLDVAYQPIVRSADGTVSAVEALLRWAHPARGPVPATSIVGIAEHCGLIHGIGTWILEQACIDRARWLADNPGIALDLTVNVSARQLTDPEFCTKVKGILVATGTDPTSVVLDVTENVLIKDGEQTTEVLAELHDLGIRLALDDFGTGFSSISYLRRSPIDIVKIDRAIVADIGLNPTGVAVVAGVTNLAHLLGLGVVAEGVETEDQRNEITAAGCELAQGYYYAQPMPASAIVDLLEVFPRREARLPAPAGRTTSRGGIEL
jgi:diguanylate cyclase (GGDEF)-like protein